MSYHTSLKDAHCVVQYSRATYDKAVRKFDFILFLRQPMANVFERAIGIYDTETEQAKFVAM